MTQALIYHRIVEIQRALAELASAYASAADRSTAQEPSASVMTPAETHDKAKKSVIARWQSGKSSMWLADVKTGKILGEVEEDDETGAWTARYPTGATRRNRKYAEFISKEDAMEAVTKWHRAAPTGDEEQA